MRITPSTRDLRRAGCVERRTSGSGSGPEKSTGGNADRALRADFHHNFLNLPHGIDDMLAEARGFRLSLVLAHQNLAQLPTELRDGISANARNKVIFATSPEDARVLARHVAPSLSEWDLANLTAYQAAARVLVDNAETPAFTLRTRPLPPAVRGREGFVRRVARATYGQSGKSDIGMSTAPLRSNDPRRAPSAGA